MFVLIIEVKVNVVFLRNDNSQSLEVCCVGNLACPGNLGRIPRDLTHGAHHQLNVVHRRNGRRMYRTNHLLTQFGALVSIALILVLNRQSLFVTNAS